MIFIGRSISDEDGPPIADHFYSHLFHLTQSSSQDGGPCLDATQAARALHFAVAKLRENRSFVRWVPFVHLGL